jgi:hypothetical protein
MMKKIIFFLIVVTLFSAGISESHHIRGIPHYSYRDNYPETPVYEVIQNVNDYEVTFTYYNIPGKTAFDLAVYIRDTVSNEPYKDPVVFLVFGKHDDPENSHPFTAYRNQTNIYKVGWVYEDEGDYFVRVTFSDSVKQHNILFELIVGNRGGVWLYLLLSVASVVLFAVVTGIVRKKQKLNGKKRLS